MTDPQDTVGRSGELHSDSFSYDVEDRRQSVERLGNGLAGLILVPSLLCFILVKSNTTNVGVGPALWAFVTLLLVLTHVYLRREHPRRFSRRRL